MFIYNDGSCLNHNCLTQKTAASGLYQHVTRVYIKRQLENSSKIKVKTTPTVEVTHTSGQNVVTII